MSLTRIGEVRAKPEWTEALRDFLISILPIIKTSQDCESVTLYRSHDDPARFLITEIWESIESQRASFNNIPTEKLSEIRPVLATAPGGSYYDVLKVE